MNLPSDKFSTTKVSLIRRVARNAGLAAERERDGCANASGVRGLRGGRIVDHADRGAGGVVADQRAQHARGVGIAAGAGIVLGVGDDDRLARACRQLHRVAHALVGRVDAAVEIVFVALDQRGDVVRRRVGIGLRPAIGEHARPAIAENPPPESPARTTASAPRRSPAPPASGRCLCVGWSLVHCQLIGIRNGNCRNAFARRCLVRSSSAR